MERIIRLLQWICYGEDIDSSTVINTANIVVGDWKVDRLFVLVHNTVTNGMLEVETGY